MPPPAVKSDDGASKYIKPYHGPKGAVGFVKQVGKHFFKHYHTGSWTAFTFAPLLCFAKVYGFVDFVLIFTGQIPGLPWYTAWLHCGKMMLCSSAAGYVYDWYNDYNDVESDAIDHPERPLPSGNMTKPQVLVLIFLWGAIHCSILFTVINKESVMWFCLSSVLAFLYDDDHTPLKHYFRRSLWGRTFTFCVAAIMCQYAWVRHAREVVYTVGITDDKFPNYNYIYLTGLPDLVSFLLRLMLKDFVGIEGDQVGGLGTWQTKLGWGGAVKMFFLACCLHRVLNIWLILLGVYGSYHLAVDCVMVAFDGYILLQAARKLVQMACGKINFGDTNTREGDALREELRKGIFTANNKWSKRFALGSPLSHLVVWNYLNPKP